MRFLHQLGDGLSLGLRTMDTAADVHRLILKNLDRLRAWEPWAQAEQTRASNDAFIHAQLEAFLAGTAVPCNIYRDEELIGSAGLRIDPYLGNGELGYWVDADHEGIGAATRSCRALLDHARDIGLARIEIRTATENRRSIAVARRLGFEQEGLLRSALPVGAERHDVAVFGRGLANSA